MASGQEIDLGTPGGSARREYERRRQRRERSALEQGDGEPAQIQAPLHETAWETGAAGEELLAAHLAKRCPATIVLHDRRLPDSKANIDHLAVAPTGVYVIDAKRYKGKIEVRRDRRNGPRLFIAGRNKTKLIEALARQQAAVEAALDPIVPEMPIHACFCFLTPADRNGVGLPLLTTPTIDGIPLLTARRLSRRLNARGALSSESQREVAEFLAGTLPAA